MGCQLPLVDAARRGLSLGKMASSRVTKKEIPPCNFPGVLLAQGTAYSCQLCSVQASQGQQPDWGSSDGRKASLPGRKVPAMVRLLSLLVVSDPLSLMRAEDPRPRKVQIHNKIQNMLSGVPGSQSQSLHPRFFFLIPHLDLSTGRITD